MADADEIEPLQTVISLRTDRTWPFVAFALVVLAAGLFVERAFCRFLCPLGAVMAIGGKLRRFTPLKGRLTPLQAPPGMRQPLPAVRKALPDTGHRAERGNQYGQIPLLPRLPVSYNDANLCPPLVQ